VIHAAARTQLLTQSVSLVAVRVQPCFLELNRVSKDRCVNLPLPHGCVCCIIINWHGADTISALAGSEVCCRCSKWSDVQGMVGPVQPQSSCLSSSIEGALLADAPPVAWVAKLHGCLEWWVPCEHCTHAQQRVESANCCPEVCVRRLVVFSTNSRPATGDKCGRRNLCFCSWMFQCNILYSWSGGCVVCVTSLPVLSYASSD
jgi:hypothetical protein